MKSNPAQMIATAQKNQKKENALDITSKSMFLGQGVEQSGGKNSIQVSNNPSRNGHKYVNHE